MFAVITEVTPDMHHAMEGTLIIEEGDGTTITVTQATEDENEVSALMMKLVNTPVSKGFVSWAPEQVLANWCYTYLSSLLLCGTIWHDSLNIFLSLHSGWGRWWPRAKCAAAAAGSGPEAGRGIQAAAASKRGRSRKIPQAVVSNTDNNRCERRGLLLRVTVVVTMFVHRTSEILTKMGIFLRWPYVPCLRNGFCPSCETSYMQAAVWRKC